MNPISPRVRRDPRDPASMRTRVPAASAVAVPAAVWIDDAAPFILAVLDLDAGRLSRDDRDLIGMARRFADDLGGGVVLAACLPDGATLRFAPEQEGADRVILLRHAAFAGDDPDTRVAAVLAAAEGCRARHIHFSDTALGADLARRVAARLGDRPAFDVRRLEGGGLVADIDAGRTEIRRPLPRVIVPARSTFAPVEANARREARAITVPISLPEPRVRDRGFLPLDPAHVPLGEADLIISAGSGLTDWPSFHAAARALGAAEAGSRVVCDAGLLPRSRQVGASGLLVEPRCYIAFGIAGASQHLQGIAAAERVIAVNTDLRAEMIKRADLAIVADAQAVLPALVRCAAARGTANAEARSEIHEPRAELAATRLVQDEAQEVLEQPLDMLTRREAWADDQHRVGGTSSVVALVSVGLHPVSKRLRRAELDGRALRLALDCGPAVTALHAGPADVGRRVLQGYAGAGAERVVVLDQPADADPVPALEAWLREACPQLIVAGMQAEAGECSGMVPYLLAERLGLALVPNVVTIEREGGTARLTQAWPGGKRRVLEADLPLIVTVGRTGPAPRLSALMHAARSTLQRQVIDPNGVDERTRWAAKPSRPRPKRLVVPPGPGQSTVTDTGRREMIDPDPEAAAAAILDFLTRDGLLPASGASEARP